MNLQSVLTILSIVTASLILLIGVVLLTGFFLPGQIPDNYRYTLGGIMTVYALYRISMAVRKYRSGPDAGPERDEQE